ncbi:MAG: GDP-mannose 4,6-dehydratase [Candidatus Aenigmarchaeota archaeon]|nr:GDP-mannose 4,6-dehydratase [Candidatus Aenigmarchaeota archaeon]
MKWEDKNVFITGANGFVASWLCKSVLEKGANVFALIKEEINGSVFNSLSNKNLKRVDGNVEDFDLMKKSIKENEIDYCLHLAAQTIVGKANKGPLDTIKTNVMGTTNVLEACRLNEIEGFVLASSDKAYGPQETLPYTEDSPLKGIFPYDASKSSADIIAQAYYHTYDMPIAITRSANIYGGGDMNFSRIVPDTIRSLIKGQAPIIRSDGTPVRQYIYVDDIVNGYLLVAENIEKVKGEPFNFGSSDPITVLDFVNLVISIYGSDVEPAIEAKSGKGEIHSQYLSSEKARKSLNWAPKVNLDTGIKKTIEWYKNHFGRLYDEE